MEILDKANYVVKMWSNPCALPWYIYAELALPAAAQAALDVVSLGSLELVREAGKVSYTGEFTPAGRFGREGLGKKLLGGAKHGRRRKGAGGPHEPPEKAGGKVVREAGKLEKATKFLWRALGPLERALFWWFILETVTDFAYNWTSLVYQCQQCTNPDSYSPLQLTFAGFQSNSCIIPKNYLYTNVVAQKSLPLAHDSSTVTLPQGRWQVILAVTLLAKSQDAGPWGVGIQGTGGFFGQAKQSETEMIPARTQADFFVAVEIEVTPLFHVTIYPYAFCTGKNDCWATSVEFIISPSNKAPCSNVFHPLS